ncbi:ubiquitin carboxyl-terminal hydrolase-like protein 22 [Aureobasidium pullulans]|uniref:Ubiquitin carboxyl-terminal hydrolase n=1 Tax=Aureobasidium pullulans TaxID=5580 RepID=A0A4V6TLI8_AURPU|nr:ubiquitin carboxyl-terminal hydrolase-like protein 22 [Aureobasidium pullulans]THX87429.1 ubiquitin carboxyl-terminal hydrolase-like protein 22 [Aureobasidium pullulans]THY17250.1 ubiquitin carboxyl-terminal hydrolase-like protein 22 [Aureobasidium pullulans]THZ79145.1 ubiquitin carboxyl-terminal hydrolase-like protein 22 [Aureobasidium pullulans]TIA59707.1 ubiquitin carboxyl-terminal hydrolase-like protein 22 [Aureobasidium pullulans]
MENKSQSPVITKKHSLADIRFPSPGSVSTHGCDHVKSQLEASQPDLIKRYTTLMQTVHKTGAIGPHLSKSSAISLRPTYLCLECSNVFGAEQRGQHDKKHILCVESSKGNIWCRECDDFVYDNALEEIRTQQGKKRKHAVFMSDVDSKILAANAAATPCRAKGLRGLYNMGQTCFMSVVLQSLIHNPFIRAFYLSVGHRSLDCEREACTSCALDDIITEFHSTEKAEGYGAVAMLQGSWKGGGNLAGYQQQDAHEYLQFILNSLHTTNLEEDEKEEKAEDCNCVIHRAFCGLMRSTVVCSKCKNVTAAVDPFMDLSLDLKSSGPKKKKNEAPAPAQAVDLTECLDRFTSPEVLQASDYRCRECDSQQSATKRLALSRLPPVLPIHLKRFSHSKTSSTSIKLDAKVHFPTILDLQPYVSRPRSKKGGGDSNGTKNGDTDKGTSPRPLYELSSVIVHKGKMDSGHYVSYAREGDEWFLFDDSKVVLVEEKEVLAAEAYMLFYIVQEIEV